MTNELEHYRGFFNELHQEAARLVANLAPAGLNWRPLPGSGDEATNSLAVTVAHLTGSERYWIGEMVGQRPARRDREAEFHVHAETAENLVRQVEDTAELIRQVLTSVPAEKLDEPITARGVTATRRWALIHGLEHAAVHLGHMQLTRQLWEAAHPRDWKPTREALREILATSKTIAVVGLSDDPDCPSHTVPAYLQAQGYRIIPVNPNHSRLQGVKSYPSLAEVDGPVDVVQVFRPSEEAPALVEAAIAKGASVVWMQPGIKHEAAAQRGWAAGLKVVMDTCMRATHIALRAEGKI